VPAPTVWTLQDGRVTYIAAERAIIAVRSYDAHHALCQILFRKSDGTIHVLFPYLDPTPGASPLESTSTQDRPPRTLTRR
jgi:hypothetical protein